MKIFKTTILILMVTLLLAWTAGCKKTNDQKVAEAELIEANKAAAEQQWQTFKAEQEVIIAANKQIIADYKAKMTDSKGKLMAAYDKKVEELEAKNTELKEKLDNYKDEGAETWETFKSEMNRDFSELGTALKNFAVDNTK